MHRLLSRLLKKFSFSEEKPPSDVLLWKDFLQKIDNTFCGWDQERYLLEKSLEISSKEMQKRFEKINSLVEEIRFREARYKAMNDASPLGVFMLDASGNCIYVNKSFEKYSGHSAEEFYEHGIFIAIHADDKSHARDSWQVHSSKWLDEEIFEKEFRFSRKKEDNGRILWGHVKAAAIIIENKFAGIIGTIDDISERKSNEDILYVQNQIFQMIAGDQPLKSICDSLVEFIESQCEGMCGSVLRVSEDKAHLRNFSAPNLPEEYCKLIDGMEIGPEVGSCGTAAHRGTCVIVKDIQSDPLWKDFRMVAAKFDFQSCWSFPLRDQDQELFATLAFYFRVPMRPSQFHLRLVEMSSHLIRIAFQHRSNIDKLEQERLKLIAANKMANLGEMAGGVAHEINNPLAIISGYAQVVQLCVSKENMDVGKIKEVTQKICNTVKRMEKIVIGLRNFSRDGSLDVKVSCKLSELVQNTLSFCGEKLHNKGIELIVADFGEEVVVCREVQVSQVLLNIVNNACDAILELNAEKRWIKIDSEHFEDALQLSITDSGNGIPLEIQEKMLEPFFTTKPIGKGTGLGLSICKGIMESHDGTLFIDNSCENTKIVLRFPNQQSNMRAS